MQHLLNQQADSIEKIMQRQGIKGAVVGGIVGPRLITFQLALAVRLREQQQPALECAIAERLAVDSASLAYKDNQPVLVIPRPEPEPVYLTKVLDRLEEVPELTATMGLDELGLPLLLRMGSPSVAHLLICGGSQSGKTQLIRNMLISLALTNSIEELEIVLIAPRSTAYSVFSRLPHLTTPVMTRISEAWQFLQELKQEVLTREQEEREQPALLVIIDDLGDLLSERPVTAANLLRFLLERGASVGLHVLAALGEQHYTSLSIPERRAFPAHVLGSFTQKVPDQLSPRLSNQVKQLLGSGDFLLITDESIERFQSCYADGRQLHKLLQSL